MRSAVKISDISTSTTTFVNTCQGSAPSERTDTTDALGIDRAASRAVTRIWKNTISVISVMIDRLPMPSSTNSTGRNTTFGSG